MYSSSSSSGCLASILARPPPSPRAMAPLPIEPPKISFAPPKVLDNHPPRPPVFPPIAPGDNALPPNKEPNPPANLPKPLPPPNQAPPPKGAPNAKAPKPILPIGLLRTFLMGRVIFLTRLPSPYSCLGFCIREIGIVY